MLKKGEISAVPLEQFQSFSLLALRWTRCRIPPDSEESPVKIFSQMLTLFCLGFCGVPEPAGGGGGSKNINAFVMKLGTCLARH